jgi:hypothetical protein
LQAFQTEGNKVRVIICGSRYWKDEQAIHDCIDELPKGSVVIEGRATGADSIAEAYAFSKGILVIAIAARWDWYGRAAGPIRNLELIDWGRPDKVIAFHDDIGNSRGTKDMVKQAKKQKIEVELRYHDNEGRIARKTL